MLRFMKNKILIPVLILTALAAFFSFKLTGEETTTEDQKKKLVLETVMKAINQGHFSPRQLDDSFSYKVYNNLLAILDNERKFFTQKDIDQLKMYEYRLDDDIKAGSVEFYTKLSALYTKRIETAADYYKEILDKPFNYSVNEEVEFDRTKIEYAANESALKERWRKILKYRSLAKYTELKKDQEKKRENKDSVNAKIKTDAELEIEARKATRKNQDYFFKRLNKLKDEDLYAFYINSILGVEDPHTDYLPPKDKQNFDVAMSGTFFGIGASLQQDDDGNIKVAAIIPGTPCWRQGDLKAGDVIMKVAQGSEEPVDIQGFDTEDAVKLIRGKLGTEVRLTVKKVNGALQEIPIIRGKVEIEETFAKSAIINGSNGPVGYIYLPEFYSDFQQINGRRCAEDVAVEIIKLKNANVKGIILDLRYNGGGSLSDVVDMAGLFVDKGPIVQVKASNSGTMVLPDQQPGLLYDGPLAIMVNYGSASASEIMAAAMQDYKRAIIVGTPTFGKGTVQQLKSLDDLVSWKDRMGMAANGEGVSSTSNSSLGSIKLTIQKFYRVNGGSTQLKGVVPDILLPDPYEEIDMGERRDKAALKWDEIAPANYLPVANAVDVPTLATLSRKRISESSTFNLIKQSADRIKKQENEKTYSLNEKIYRQKLEEANETAKKMEDLQKEVSPLVLTNLSDDLQRINIDSTTIKKNEDWLTALKKDIYISETVNIINDMSRMNMKVTMSDVK